MMEVEAVAEAGTGTGAEVGAGASLGKGLDRMWWGGGWTVAGVQAA